MRQSTQVAMNRLVCTMYSDIDGRIMNIYPIQFIIVHSRSNHGSFRQSESVWIICRLIPLTNRIRYGYSKITIRFGHGRLSACIQTYHQQKKYEISCWFHTKRILAGKGTKKNANAQIFDQKVFFFQKIVSHACVYKKKAVSLQNFKTNDKFLYINPKI